MGISLHPLMYDQEDQVVGQAFQLLKAYDHTFAVRRHIQMLQNQLVLVPKSQNMH